MKNALHFWVGLFVLLGGLAICFLVFQTTSATWSSNPSSYQLTAYFDNVGGLKKRSPIKSSGVVVGRVSEISFDPKRYRAKVVLDIDGRYQFPKDSSLKILTSGLLGEQFLGLEAGGDDQLLNTGSEIKMTQSAVVLENLISQFLYNKAQDTPANSNAASSTSK